jgi:hypothetical protein
MSWESLDSLSEMGHVVLEVNKQERFWDSMLNRG